MLHTKKCNERAFIGNYEKLGYMKDNIFVMLCPKKKIKTFQLSHPEADPQAGPVQEHYVDETIAYYQGASTVFGHHRP